MGASVTIGRPGQFAAFERECKAAIERAALRATARAARQATGEIRDGMRGAGLGRLSNAIGSGSDLTKNGHAQRRGQGLSASGWVHVRGRSARTVGAIEAYTEGANITPAKGKWLAIPTSEIPKRAGRQKMTPKLYDETGLNERIGPLRFVRGRAGGEALLIVQDVTVDRFGRAGKARRLPKRGALGPSRERRDFIVAFVLIKTTTRSARVNPLAIIAANAARLPDIMADELGKEI